MRRKSSYCVSVLFLAIAAPLAGEEAGGARRWGQGRLGLQLSMRLAMPVRQRGAVRIQPAIRNVGTVAVDLPPAGQITAFLTVLRGRQEGLVTAAIPLAPDGAWPAKLAPGMSVSVRQIELAGLKAYGPERRRVLQAMRALVSGQDKQLPEPAGTLGQVLQAGPARVVLSAYLPRADGGLLRLASAPEDIEIDPPAMDELSARQRKAYLDQLIRRFDRDAWAGQAAHRTAVAIGKPAVPALVVAAGQKDRPRHSRMWLTTALADIRDPAAAKALIDLLDEESAAVRAVVAYHGPKQRDKALDAAIVAAATKSKAPARITALALLGYLVHRQAVPEKLLSAGLGSDDQRTRSVAVEALKAHASKSAIARLVQRLADEDPRIRALAAEALKAMNTPAVRTWAVAAALVRALDLPGEDARKRITETLSTLTGTEILYDPDAPEARRKQTLQAWRDWLKARRR